MFKNPIAIVGFCISGVAWLLLLFVAGLAGVINFHLLAIFENATYFGYLLVLVGVMGWAVEKLKEEFDHVKTLLKGNAEMRTAWEVAERNKEEAAKQAEEARKREFY